MREFDTISLGYLASKLVNENPTDDYYPPKIARKIQKLPDKKTL